MRTKITRLDLGYLLPHSGYHYCLGIKGNENETLDRTNANSQSRHQDKSFNVGLRHMQSHDVIHVLESGEH